jgi:NAD(P)-dependent dehydrogenase (short-subunit alcohol dehydrogenase family)
MRFIVTGANRGIGLELARQLTARGDTVLAGVRDPASAEELRSLASSSSSSQASRIQIHACDVASDESARAFAASLGAEPVDVLINNAGIYGKGHSLEELDLDDVARTYNVNALGPIRVTRAVLPLLRKGKTRKIVHITSGMGSVTDNTSGGSYGYRMSKAALNMAAKSMSVDLRPEGILSVVMNPGWVKTDMGGPGAPTDVKESASRMIGMIDEMTLDDTGKFFDFKGGTIPY